MSAAALIREARRRAGLTQQELAARSGTSQPTLSTYESGRKDPSVATLERLLAATGAQLAVKRDPAAASWSEAHAEIAGHRLAEVLALAEALPARRRGRLRYPSLAPPS
jgi:transcriptional regulator with XRE-family HTH domain